jgi:hypothetical protein
VMVRSTPPTSNIPVFLRQRIVKNLVCMLCTYTYIPAGRHPLGVYRYVLQVLRTKNSSLGKRRSDAELPAVEQF